MPVETVPLYRLPDDSQHHLIVGVNGSGKTQAGLWHLSRRRYDRMPWIVYNWKRDHNIDSIPGHVDIQLDELPETPGIYVVHPNPGHSALVEAQMQAIWTRAVDEGKGTGIFVDEGYMIPQNTEWFRTILTQGRSLQIPTITLSQRPVGIDRWIVSEATFYQIFRLNHKKDRQIVQEFIPKDKIDLEKRLPAFHSYYYDVGENAATEWAPVPNMRSIHATFAARLQPKQQKQA